MKKILKSWKFAIFSVILIFILFLAFCIGLFKWYYPYGMRSATLPLMLLSLRQYAEHHDGFFPMGGETNYDSLQKLYPEYCTTGRMLAGLSGDIEATIKTLKEKGKLNGTISSWEYFPGFNINDSSDIDYDKYPGIALILEKQSGITFNGSRAKPGSHAVGFVNGVWRQIPREEWKGFVEQQKILRKKILSSRLKSQKASGD